eukprot:Gb_13477 [translate_table: standard]
MRGVEGGGTGGKDAGSEEQGRLETEREAQTGKEKVQPVAILCHKEQGRRKARRGTRAGREERGTRARGKQKARRGVQARKEKVQPVAILCHEYSSMDLVWLSPLCNVVAILALYFPLLTRPGFHLSASTGQLSSQCLSFGCHPSVVLGHIDVLPCESIPYYNRSALLHTAHCRHFKRHALLLAIIPAHRCCLPLSIVIA